MSSASKLKIFAGVALFGSGAAALIYQILWMRSFGLVFGNTTRATSVVLAIFMGGLALGGYFCRRWKFKNALRAYATLELLMALSALAGRVLLEKLPQIYAFFAGAENFSAWLELFLKITAATSITLPTAIAAGMTLPVMTECLSRRGFNSAKGFARLYLINTLGAAFGTLGSAFWLIPMLGTEKTYAIAIALNLIIGSIAWRLSSPEETAPVAPLASPKQATQRRINWLAFGSGFSAFLLEVVWVRSLVLVIGSSTYSFSVMLGSLLLGIALGAWVYQKIQFRIRHTKAWLAWTCLFISAMILASYALMGMLPDIYMKAIERFQHSFATFQIIGFLVSFFTLLLVTLPQGFFFPMLLSLHDKNEFLGQKQVGDVYFWNTLGALTGSLSAGLLLIPLTGFRGVYLLASLSSGLLGLALLLSLPQERRSKILQIGLSLIAAILIFKFYKPWNPQIMSMGIYENGFKIAAEKIPGESLEQYFSRTKESLVYYSEGEEAVVSVKRLPNGSTVLANNGKADASDSGDLGTQKLLAHIPFTLFPHAKRIYLVGWGSGSTAGSASLHPATEIDCAEIEKKVFDAAEWFSSVNFEVQKDPRFKIRFKDARNDLLASSKNYDLIISEPPNPWIAGVSNLFTSEFYELAKSRLNENGVFGQWFPYYGMTLADIQLQFRTFCHAFPETQLWILTDQRKHLALSGDLILIGSRKNLKPDYEEVKKLFQNSAMASDLAQIGITEPWALLSLQLLNRREMLAFAGEGPLNTDGFPRIEFSAPRSHFRTLTEQALSNQEIFNSLASHRQSHYPDLLHSPFDKPGLEKKSRAHQLGLLAAHYSNLSLFGQSLKILDELRSLGTEDATTAYYRGKNLFYSNPDVNEGIKELEKALRLDPSNKNFYSLLGQMYLQAKRFEEARQLFLRGSKKWPDDIGFIFGQGLVKYREKNFSEARILFEKVLAMNPSHPGAKSLLETMRSQGQ